MGEAMRVTGTRFGQGVVAARMLAPPDLRMVTVVPQLFGAGLLTLVEVRERAPEDEMTTWDRGYRYETLAEALAAMEAWTNGDVPPPGNWVKAYGDKRTWRPVRAPS